METVSLPGADRVLEYRNSRPVVSQSNIVKVMGVVLRRGEKAGLVCGCCRTGEYLTRLPAEENCVNVHVTAAVNTVRQL